MPTKEEIKNGVVVIREDGKFNFEFMTDSEMCYLLEQLIEEINRRKAGTVDVGFWDKAGEYKEDRQPVQNAVVDLGITVHGGIKTADVTVEVEDEKFSGKPLGVKDKNGKQIVTGDILRTTDCRYCTAIFDRGQIAVESPGSHAIDYEQKEFFNNCVVVTNIRHCPDFYEVLIEGKENE